MVGLISLKRHVERKKINEEKFGIISTTYAFDYIKFVLVISYKLCNLKNLLNPFHYLIVICTANIGMFSLNLFCWLYLILE